MEKPQQNLTIPELEPIRKGGITWMSLYRIFYYTRLFRYIHKDQYKLIPGIQEAACSYPKLKELERLGYLIETNKDSKVFSGTTKCQKYIERNWLFRYIPKIPEGEGKENALNNTAAFIKAIQVPDYYDIHFPEFGYIDPDALLIQKKENGTYKLTCLEIESEKYGWDGYLENKRDNYLKLAKDLAFYDFWKEAAPLLNLRIPTPQELCFTVTFVCSVQREFGEGFKFRKHLE